MQISKTSELYHLHNTKRSESKSFSHSFKFTDVHEKTNLQFSLFKRNNTSDSVLLCRRNVSFEHNSLQFSHLFTSSWESSSFDSKSDVFYRVLAFQQVHDFPLPDSSNQKLLNVIYLPFAQIFLLLSIFLQNFCFVLCCFLHF